MPARNVDAIFIQNWQNMGTTVPVDKWSVDITVQWTDLEGAQHEHQGTYNFPNVLADVPLHVIRRFMEEIIIAKVRVTLGIDEWSE
jgi:hypothetical protein